MGKIMKFQNCLLSLAAVILLAGVTAFAAEDIEDLALLISKPDPALAGIEPICVVISNRGDNPDKSALLLKNIKKKIEDDLKKAGIEVLVLPDNNCPPELPELTIALDIMQQKNTSRYFLHIQTSLAKLVYLEKNSTLSIKTDVWKIGPDMEVTPIENLQTLAMRIASKQVDVFISACVIANPLNKNIDPNTIAAQKPVQDKRPFVASKNGKIFHKADCVWVSRIKPANRVSYDTTQDAANAGKNPCKKCKP